MPLFTCISCRVVFANSELQKAHYRTDWHRYNLKRKVADLPPVTAVDFQHRVLERKAQISEAGKSQGSYCKLCCKHFGSTRAYGNHVLSKKHQEKELKETQSLVQKENEKNTEKGIYEENIKELPNKASKLEIINEGASSSSGGLGMKYCVPSTKSNLKKPADPVAQASTSADDEDSDCESEGSWESVEGEAIPIEACLFCPVVSKSLEKNMQHMTQAHRFFIPDAEYLVDVEGLIAYLGEKVGEGNMCLWCNDRGKTFYSIRSAQQHMTDKNHCKILHEGDALLEYSDFYDYRPSYPDYKETEDDGDDDDEEVNIEELASDGYELVLPSGATIGHRSLQVYYKQNLPPRKYTQTGKLLPRLLAQYKSLGWTGISGPAAQKKAKDVAYVQHLRSRQHLKLSIKANKLQKHFRPQVVF
ncbi:zinc finger protein 622 [Octopus sinensis]|uniref:Zinc finger protein 622 n=1 Tax=Octopus sinensis TaxID=2607531 RepID=A0A6P7STZ0_9MOLL|nr:zinc finger protein 622 [Octopus sinensis]XP_036362655.1 zinc finger protein 622 [Octopus sinensis]